MNQSKMSVRLTVEDPIILVATRNHISTEWINKATILHCRQRLHVWVCLFTFFVSSHNVLSHYSLLWSAVNVKILK